MKDGEGSVLAIAMNTRVKLIYRPASIRDGRKDAEKQLKLEQRDNGFWLKNPTPYFMAIVNVKHDGKDVTLSDKVMKNVTSLAVQRCESGEEDERENQRGCCK